MNHLKMNLHFFNLKVLRKNLPGQFFVINSLHQINQIQVNMMIEPFAIHSKKMTVQKYVMIILLIFIMKFS